MGTLTIGKNKKRIIKGDHTSMLAMPAPVGWGDKAKAAKGEGNMRLEKGELRFEKIPVLLFADRKKQPEPVADRVMERMDEDTRRLVYPVVQESNDPDPPDRNAAPFRHVDEEISEYSRPGDSDAICDELREQMRTLSFRMVVCGISVLFLGAIELLPMLGVQLPDMFLPDKAPIVYLTINLVFLIFCMGLCRNIIFGGLQAIFRGKMDGDGITSIACTAVALQTAAEFVTCFVQRQPMHNVCAAPAILALLINDMGLLVMTRRVARNFRFVAMRGVRRATKLVSGKMEFDELIHADKQHHESIAYTVRAKFLANYLHFSYEEDFCEQMMSRLSPYILPVAAIAGVIGGIISFKEWGIWGGIYCLCAVLVAGMPICRILCLNLPLSKASKELIPNGVMLNGWAAADKFGRVDTLAVNSDALFPDGTVRLLSVRAFGDAPIDRSVLYAASIVIGSGGPLAQVFYNLLEGHTERLLHADGIGYENEMGVSGWVESLPVLVGNRRMMKRHGIDLPSRDYEQLLKKGKNRSLVYIAISGRPCAVMLVQYRADNDTAVAVHNMVAHGVSLVVYTTDPNVTSSLVSEIYDLPERQVSILSVKAGSEYDRLTHTIRDRAPAVLCTIGRLSALADGITAAIRLRSMLVFNTIIQMVCYGLGVTLTAVLCCISGSGAVSPTQIMLLQIMCLLAVFVSLFRKAL